MSEIILLDNVFLEELAKDTKNFIEILDLWTDPDPTVTTSTYRFVSYNSSITYEGNVYSPIGAIRSPVSDSINGQSRSIQITIDGINVIDTNTNDSFLSLIRKINIKNSKILLRRITANLATNTPKIIFSGYINEYSCTSTTFQCSCTSVLNRWTNNKSIPNRLAGPGCQVPFGCSACGVIAAQGGDDLFDVVTKDGFPAMLVGTPVISSNGLTLIDSSALSSITDANHFHKGVVRIWKKIVAGVEVNHPYKGRYSFIKSFDPATSVITLEFPLPLTNTDSNITIVHYRATCGNTKSECNKWQNLNNYKGMDVPKIPVLNVSSERY